MLYKGVSGVSWEVVESRVETGRVDKQVGEEPWPVSAWGLDGSCPVLEV